MNSPEIINGNIKTSKNGTFDKMLLQNIEKNFFRQQVPHISQKKENLKELGLDDEKAKYWEDRSCGYICLLMGLKYFYGEINYDIENIDYDSTKSYDFFDFYNAKEKSYKFFTKENGWLHYGLLQMARELGLYGFYKKFPKEKQKFMISLVSSLNENYFVTASVGFKGSISQYSKDSHLLVISGYDIEKNELILNDPYNQNESKVDIDEFLEKFNGTVFMIAEKPDEEMLVSSPFLIEKDNEGKGNFTSLVVHQDETSALNLVESLDDVEKIFFRQNGERSLRFRVGNILLRVDPNRIFTNEGALKTILQLNKHIIDSQIQDVNNYYKYLIENPDQMTEEISDALSIVKNIKNYLLSKLNIEKPVVAIHNNRFMDISKNFKEYEFYQNNDIPKNCFVIVNNFSDFENLMKNGISVVLMDKIDGDGGFSDFANIEGIRYFNIETGFNNSDIQKSFYNKISSIIELSS
ncbi:C39 family peptidase [Candidatus Vampirococcus lugosii]|uniref:Peptidase, C3 family n=1 Tax=Candidatus Vampirococcus lugosii TaxID=2789015 RepID=A0ABS5QN45_9BACT|nr:C39 family peptidase [Candidatus Vampirococcus lugosii]MBS8122106.1 putative peptidase, C3 family [Candidatus Vampirococcus lugosii]